MRFLFVFAVLTWIGRWEPVLTSVREPYCELLARSLAIVFSWLSLDAVQTGSTVYLGVGKALTIIPSCDGMALLSLFCAGVASIPLQRTARPYAWAVGALGLLVMINWLRLALLVSTTAFQPEFFEVIHVYLLQGALILAVGILYLAWVFGALPDSTPTEAAQR